MREVLRKIGKTKKLKLLKKWITFLRHIMRKVSRKFNIHRILKVREAETQLSLYR